MNSKRHIFLTFILLIASILFFGFSSLDKTVQDLFYNSNSQEWLLDKHLEPYKFIFYDGIKKLLILFALSILIALLFFRRKELVQHYKRGLLIVLLSAIFIPLITGALKKSTNMPCPKNEIHYGGIYPSTKVWEHYPKSFEQPSKIRCFPAGHASGGFALLSLFFLFKSRRNKIKALILALSVGWSMGMYKMMIGDHFLSHTIITMLLAWLIVLIIASLLKEKEKPKV